jgi:endonuclease III
MVKKITKKEYKEILIDTILSSYTKEKLNKRTIEELETIVNTTIMSKKPKER